MPSEMSDPILQVISQELAEGLHPTPREGRMMLDEILSQREENATLRAEVERLRKTPSVEELADVIADALEVFLSRSRIEEASRAVLKALGRDAG